MARYKRRKYSHKPGREKDAGRCADDRRFEQFIQEHNAAAGRFAAAVNLPSPLELSNSVAKPQTLPTGKVSSDDDIQAAEDRAAAEDFAERHLIKMRRSLGVME